TRSTRTSPAGPVPPDRTISAKAALASVTPMSRPTRKVDVVGLSMVAAPSADHQSPGRCKPVRARARDLHRVEHAGHVGGKGTGGTRRAPALRAGGHIVAAGQVWTVENERPCSGRPLILDSPGLPPCARRVGPTACRLPLATCMSF